MAREPQPAKVSYFFGKGYIDLRNTILEAWALNITSAKNQFALAREKGIFTIGGGINLIAAISIFVFGSIITAITTGIHIAVLLLFFACIYIGFGVLWLIDRIYIMLNKIKNACPNPDYSEIARSSRYMSVRSVEQSIPTWSPANMVSFGAPASAAPSSPPPF